MSFQSQPAAARGLLSADAPPALFASALAEPPGVVHAFFGRQGGVSTGIYASLNAGPGSRDDPAAVAENRRRLASALNAELIGVHQVHSARAVFVGAPWPGDRPEADALVPTRPGLALSILTADCTPVLFADAEARVIGAAHAGWKGAFGGVLENTVALMEEHGASRARMVAAIGPCIQKASYQVGPEFEARFREADPANTRFFSPGGGDKFQFDLPAYCAARLGALSVQVVDLGADTYAHDADFFSHRRSLHAGDDDYGRNCSAIALRAE
ncbi:MAG: peptidoglycan editing factor PgeF [Terricaulis silvestris]